LSELPKSLISFYEELRENVRENAKKENLNVLETTFDFREIRTKINCTGSETIKKYIRMLVYYEYIQISSGGNRGQRNRYRLVADEPIDKIDLSVIPTVEEIYKLIENSGIWGLFQQKLQKVEQVGKSVEYPLFV